MTKEIWNKPNPKKEHKKLSSSEKSSAKAKAKAAGRPYPNAVNNINAAKKKTKNEEVLSLIKRIIRENVKNK